MKFAIIGLGKMGSAMVTRLMERGHDVVGWDVDAGKGGENRAASPADAVARADTIISIVTDDAAVEWLFGSDGGLLTGNAGDKLFIEMSTLRPGTVRAVGAKAEKAGARLVAAPVLGTIPQVRAGQLLALASGREEDIARARTALADLTREVVALGPLGQGNVMKLIANMNMAAYIEALAEGLAMGLEAGLSLEQMFHVLGQGPLANAWLQTKRDTLLGKAKSPMTLTIDALRKDVLSTLATGAEVNVTMPLTAGVLSALSAAVAAGYGGEDLGEVTRFVQEKMVRRPAKH